METPTLVLPQCENLISKGKTEAVLDKLFSIKESTVYKNEIITLCSRSKKLSRKQISGILSNEELSLQNSRLNMDLLHLIEALRKEQKGENVSLDFSPPKTSQPSLNHSRNRVYIAIALIAIGVWALSYFAYGQAQPVVCEESINLSGTWSILSHNTAIEKNLGEVTITQNQCDSHFKLSGSVISTTNIDGDVDFNSKVGGINDGEVLFIYENSEGELGVGRGLVPFEDKEEFIVHFSDLVGRDKNGESRGSFTFRRIAQN